jgi:aminoglycoside N3'-acetyltransferase
MGITRGDVVHMHSSVSHLMRGSNKKSEKTLPSILSYVSSVLDVLIELIGPDGTLLMNTDSIKNAWVYSLRNEIFDYAKAPSRRGLISEIFRRKKGAIRSVNPSYNVTGWGKHAEDLIRRHEQSTPYTMDRDSPWYRITELNGKVLCLGNGWRYNSSVHLPAESIIWEPVWKLPPSLSPGHCAKKWL